MGGRCFDMKAFSFPFSQAIRNKQINGGTVRTYLGQFE